VQEERTQRIEAELDRLVLEQHVNRQSLAGVNMLPDDRTSNEKCKRSPAKNSKKKRTSQSQYVQGVPVKNNPLGKI